MIGSWKPCSLWTLISQTPSKPPRKLSSKNADFFAGLEDIAQVVVLGHSLNQVDAPYLVAVVQALQHRQVGWTVAVLPSHDLGEQSALLAAVGVSSEQIHYKLWSDLHEVASDEHR